MCSNCGGNYEDPEMTAPEPVIDARERDMVQQFLQIHHAHGFSSDYLAWYLQVPQENVEEICEALVGEGAAFRPAGTQLVQGIEVDWAAVHAGRAAAPRWSSCDHKFLRWNGSRGEFRCLDCDDVIEAPELLEGLGPEAHKPYDVFVEQ